MCEVADADRVFLVSEGVRLASASDEGHHYARFMVNTALTYQHTTVTLFLRFHMHRTGIMEAFL